MSRRAWLEVACVLLGVASFIALADLATTETRPLWDGRHYRNLALHGYGGELLAPFAYRPGMPFLARWLTLASNLPVDQSFRILGRAAAGLTLLLVYGGARSVGRAGPTMASFVTACTALCYYHVRFPLFFWSMVDVAAYPLMLIAFHWIWRGKIWRAGLLGAFGLLFKEFLLLPWLVAVAQGALIAWRRRSRRHAARSALLFGLGLAVYVTPRKTLEVERSWQWIDPLNDPEALSKLGTVLTDPAHLVAVLTAVTVYWTPTLMLMTRARWRALTAAVAPYRVALILYLLLLLPLILCGGKNVDIFASYALAAQWPILCGMLSSDEDRLRPLEAALVITALIFVQQWFTAIPDPKAFREAYMSFHGFGGLAVSGARLVEVGAWIAGATVLRFVSRRHAPAARLS
jgi:hypothetical protein